MTDNFFLDNPDLQFRLNQLDLREIVAIKERGYTYHPHYPAAPRNYADALDNYRLVLEVLGEICATRIAPAPPRPMSRVPASTMGRLHTRTPPRLPWRRCASPS